MHFLNVPRVVAHNLLAQAVPVYVHIYLRGADILVAKHLLNGTQVGASLQEMGGKTVAESVG